MGILLLLLGLGALGYGIFQHFKGKRILAAPFKKTGELSQRPISSDPKGAMSTEGQVVAPATPLLTPCSLQPCLAYELVIERLFEKFESTSEGTKSSKGSETVETMRKGTEFQLDDGSGAFAVDFSKGVDFDTYVEGFKKELGGSNASSNVQFGELRFDVPINRDANKVTLGFRATEKYVPVSGKMFVLGKLEGAKLVKPGWRSLLASAKGREGLLGNIQKHKKYAFIGGGVASFLGLILALFFGSSECNSSFKGELSACSSTLKSKEGFTYQWEVNRPGEYTVVVETENSKFDPELTLRTTDGEVVAHSASKKGKVTQLQADLSEGKYELVVEQHLGPVAKNGFDFTLSASSVASKKPKAEPKEEVAEKVSAKEQEAPKAVTAEEAPPVEEEMTQPADSSQNAALFEALSERIQNGLYEYEFTHFDCQTAKKCVLIFKAVDPDDRDSQLLGEVNIGDVRENKDYESVVNAIERWEKIPTDKKVSRSRKLKQRVVAKSTRWTEYLSKLEQLCSNSLCQGYFQYRFKQLDCESAAKCFLTIDAKDSDGTKYTAQLLISNVKPLRDPQWPVAFEKAITRWENLPKGMKMRASTASANEGLRK